MWPYFVAASSNEAIITIVPSGISFKNLMKGATSTQDREQLTQHMCMEISKKVVTHTHLQPTYRKCLS